MLLGDAAVDAAAGLGDAVAGAGDVLVATAGDAAGLGALAFFGTVGAGTALLGEVVFGLFALFAFFLNAGSKDDKEETTDDIIPNSYLEYNDDDNTTQ